MPRMTPEELDRRSETAWSHTRRFRSAHEFKEVEAHAFAAGVEQGMVEARKVIGAPLSDEQLAEITNANLHTARPVRDYRNADIGKLFEHIDYLSSVIALMTHDSGEYQQGKIDGLMEAKGLVEVEATTPYYGDKIDADKLHRILEKRIAELRSS